MNTLSVSTWRNAISRLSPIARQYVRRTYVLGESTIVKKISSTFEIEDFDIDLNLILNGHRCDHGPFVDEAKKAVLQELWSEVRDGEAKIQEKLFVFEDEFSDELESVKIDSGMGESLFRAISSAKERTTPDCWIYFKRWRISSEVMWYKIGITHNPLNRDVEQNVLPVPAEDLYYIKLESFSIARAIEAELHRQLKAMQIKMADNKELFVFSPSEAATVYMVLKKFDAELSKSD